MAALNWGVGERTSAGRRLLRENPLFGVKLPKEKNLARPVMSHDVYLKLLGQALAGPGNAANRNLRNNSHRNVI